MTPSLRDSKTVVVIGTLDTKGQELGYLRDQLKSCGVATVLVDVGILGAPTVEPDVDRHEVAAATCFDLDSAGASEERGGAVAAMSDAAAVLVQRLHAEGRCDGILGAGGGGNTAIATAAMRALPIGIPKLMVSTLAGGDARPFVGASDIGLIPAVVDVAGLNSMLRPVLARAAAAMAGMMTTPPPDPSARQTRLAATMFGVTTPCVAAARELLESRGFEVVTFHATGTGGRAMEQLVSDGCFAGVLDATTTELADELVGGTLSAGPDRLTAAGAAGLPQVVSLGALDIVNFGPPNTVPERFERRRLSAHNPQVTLMRTNSEECETIGVELARKLSSARGPVALYVPMRGVSALSCEGGVFHDPEADAALFRSLRENLSEAVEVHEIDADINDPEFARAMGARLADYLVQVQA